jgi:hypothetical protein
MEDERIISIRMLSGIRPILLTPPYTIGHVRKELLYENDIEGKGVEYLSLYNVDGRCQLDDDLVYEDDEYYLFVHTTPIVRYYIEDTDEVREIEVKNTTVKEAYDAFWRSCLNKENEYWLSYVDALYFTLRECGMSLYYVDEIDNLVGKEICVNTIYHAESYELE